MNVGPNVVTTPIGTSNMLVTMPTCIWRDGRYMRRRTATGTTRAVQCGADNAPCVVFRERTGRKRRLSSKRRIGCDLGTQARIAGCRISLRCFELAGEILVAIEQF